jgi:hypothetical protein
MSVFMTERPSLALRLPKKKRNGKHAAPRIILLNP